MTQKIRFKNLITKQENFPIRIWNVPGELGPCWNIVSTTNILAVQCFDIHTQPVNCKLFLQCIGMGQQGSMEQNFLDTWVQNRRFMTMKHWILLIYFGYYLLGFMFVLFPCTPKLYIPSPIKTSLSSGTHNEFHFDHGLRTPNEGINQRNLKFWANVADKICFGRT